MAPCSCRRAGEAFYLTQREKLRLAEIALEELGDKTLVFSGVMQTTTRACVEGSQNAQENRRARPVS
jgi:dihydrodipicolinate synthase/N-acetylneuraminate lyase